MMDTFRFNRDNLAVRIKQCVDRLQQMRARWQTSMWLDSQYARVEDHYGRSRALAEMRVRKIERELDW